jgi:hypothetical protein
MRRLTVKQKKYLDELIESYDIEHKVISHVDDLTEDEWNHLEELNDTEILYQEVNRYLSDKVFEGLRKYDTDYPRNNNKGPFAPF